MKNLLISIFFVIGFLLTACNYSNTNKTDIIGRIYNTEFTAILTTMNDYHKIVYFEVDDYLYVLTLINDEQGLVYNLDVKDKNNPLLFNGPSLYLMRSEFIENERIITESFIGNNGIIIEYNLLTGTINNEKY